MTPLDVGVDRNHANTGHNSNDDQYYRRDRYRAASRSPSPEWSTIPRKPPKRHGQSDHSVSRNSHLHVSRKFRMPTELFSRHRPHSPTTVVPSVPKKRSSIFTPSSQGKQDRKPVYQVQTSRGSQYGSLHNTRREEQPVERRYPSVISPKNRGSDRYNTHLPQQKEQRTYQVHNQQAHDVNWVQAWMKKPSNMDPEIINHPPDYTDLRRFKSIFPRHGSAVIRREEGDVSVY